MVPRARLLLAATAASLAAAALVSPLGLGEAQQGLRSIDGRMAGPVLRVAKVVASGVQPKSVAVSPDGARVYVCNFGRPDRDNVFVYDAYSLDHVGTIEFEGNAVEAAFSPDGRTLYVSNFRRNLVEVIDVATHTVRAEVELGVHPKVIVPSPDGRLVYVANWSGNTVSVFDAETLQVVRTLPTGTHPRGMVVREDGTLFVAAMYSHQLHEFAPGASRDTRRVPLCRFPRHVLFTADRSQLIVSCSSNRTVRWYDVASGRQRIIAAVGENPRTIDQTSDGRYVVTADFDSSTITVIDTVDGVRRVNDVPGADMIVGIAVHPGPDLRIYATSWANQRLLMLGVEGIDLPERAPAPEPPPPPPRPPKDVELVAREPLPG